MTLLSMGELLGGWSEGCVVMLAGVWLFLALLGIRNSRFPWRVAGGVCFVVGSALWLGLHRELAASLRLESGFLGFLAHKHLVEPLTGAGAAFGLQALGATLLLCSLFGLLVAIDWLPLLPLAPWIATLEQRMRFAGAAGASSAATSAPTSMLRSSAAAVLEREPKARPIAAPVAPPIGVVAPAAAPSSSAPPPAVDEAPRTVAAAKLAELEVTPSVESTEPFAPAESAPATIDVAHTVDATDDEPPVATNWARFRPRPSVELPVDNASTATHNSPTPEDEGDLEAPESRASDAPPAPAPATEEKDLPVLEDRIEEDVPSTSSTAVAEPPRAESAESGDSAESLHPVEATESTESTESTVAEPSDETLAPKRKKEDPEEEPAEKPDEDDEEEGEEDEEKDGEEWEDEEGEEDEDEEWDEEKEDKEEDWEEDDEKKEGEEEGKDDKEEEEEDEDEDEDWDEDEDEEDDEEEEDDDEKWEGDESSKNKSSAPVAVESPAEPVSTPALTLEREPESSAPVPDELEPLVPPVVTTAPPALPVDLFADLPPDERQLLVRAVDLIAGSESVSLSRLQRELGVTYYASARVFERLEKEGFVAPYSGSLARTVKVTREEWESRRRP